MSKHIFDCIPTLICWFPLFGQGCESLAQTSRLEVPHTLDLYIPTPEDNRLSADRIDLGKKLFFDPLSGYPLPSAR